MAWLLVGLGVTAVGSYIVSEISGAYDTATKPIYDYFKQREIEAGINERELRRQERIAGIKLRKAKTNMTISKLGIKLKNIVTIINNLEEAVDVIFVNFDRATSPTQAIDWAKQILSANVFNKSNTRCDHMSPYTGLELIKQEMLEYQIVLHMATKYVVLDKADFDMTDMTDISVRDKFNVKNTDVNVECKWFK